MPEEQVDGHGVTPTVWIMVAVIIAGTILGGIGLIEWNGIEFWVGVGLFVLGLVGGYAAGMMDAVTEYGVGEGQGSGGDPDATLRFQGRH